MLDSIFKSKPYQAVSWGLLVLTLFCPGSFYIAIYRPDLFTAYDLPRVLLISAAIAVPLMLLNFLVFELVGLAIRDFRRARKQIREGKLEAASDELAELDDKERREKDRKEQYVTARSIVGGCFVTLVVLYVPLVTSGWLGRPLGLSATRWLIFIVEVSVVLVLSRVAFDENKKLQAERLTPPSSILRSKTEDGGVGPAPSGHAEK